MNSLLVGQDDLRGVGDLAQAYGLGIQYTPCLATSQRV